MKYKIIVIGLAVAVILIFVGAACTFGRTTLVMPLQEPTPTLQATSTVTSNDRWNDTGIRWLTIDSALLEAQTTGKPVFIVFYTDWCGYCRRYARAFWDPSVVEMTDQLLMVRVNQDNYPEISDQYYTDGSYIPRTVLLTPKGEINWDIPDELVWDNVKQERTPEAVVKVMEMAIEDSAVQDSGADKTN